MKFCGTTMFLFICFLAFTCVNGDLLEDSYDSVKDMLISLSKGEMDQEELNFALEDLGIELDGEDADLVLMDYSTKVNGLNKLARKVNEDDHRRSKRSTAAATCQGYGYYYDLNTADCYKYVWLTDQRTYNEAKTACGTQLGGTLITIHSEEEWQFVKGKLEILDKSAWIGGSDIEQEGTWLWTDGSPVSISEWSQISRQQPDVGHIGDGEDCIVAYKPHNYQWHDVPCDRTYSAMCKIPVQVRSNFDLPIETVDIHLEPIVKIDSTTMNAKLSEEECHGHGNVYTADCYKYVYSPSFSLSRDSLSYTFIIGDKQIYPIKEGRVIKSDMPDIDNLPITFVYSDAPEAKVVRTTVVAGTTSDHAFVVQVTLRDAEGEKFKHAYFTAWKVSIITGALAGVTLITEQVVDFQVVKSPRLIAPDNSYSRVSMLELGTTDRFLTASFHKLESEKTVDGPHLALINADRTEIPIYSTNLAHQHLTDDLKDLKLVKVYGEEVYFLYVINTVRLFIFRLEPNGNTFDISLIQKCASNGGVYLNGNSDSIATTVTIVRDDGTTKTFIYNNYNSFIEMRHFTLDIAVDTWRQVGTNISPADQSREQELVVFRTTGGDLKFMRHVLPGVYELFELPVGLGSYLDDNPNWEILDIGRFEKDGGYDYYLLMLIDGTTIDYIKVNIQFVSYNIESLNDASLCLQNLENILLLDKDMLTEIDVIEPGLINLDSSVTAVTNAILSAKKVTVTGPNSFNNIEITMHSDSDIVYDVIDYNIPTSTLAVAHAQANRANTDPDHIFANIVFADGPFVSTKTFSLTAQTVTLDSSRFTTLSTRLIGQKATDDLVHNILMLEGDQDIACNFEFTSNLKVTGDTLITNNASPDGPVIVPSDFIDISKSNSINLAITANTFKFATDHTQTLNTICKLNDIKLEDILTIAEMEASTTAAPVSVSGVKTITGDIIALNAEFSFIGTRSFADLSGWYDSIIWKNAASQTISVNTLSFDSIVANTGMTIPTINEIDVTTGKLNDIFLDINGDSDTPLVISGNVVFNAVSFDDLIAPLLNAVDPSHYLINTISQTIDATVSFNKLVTNGNVQDSINTWTDINTDAVRVDIPQTISTLIVFGSDITVNTALNLADGIKLAGVDFSEVGRIKHVYEEVVVSDSLSLKDLDVTVSHISFNGVTISNFNTDSLRDEYLMMDIAQTLPNLVSIVPDVAIKNLVVHDTLDGISLDNVLKTSGDQAVSTSALKLTGRTKFYQNVIMSQWTAETADDNNADINGIKIRELRDDILCDKSETSNPINSNTNSVLTIDDTSGLEVISYFDIEVIDNFKVGTGTDSSNDIVYKDFGPYNNEVVHLRKTNTFNSLVKFTKPVSTDGTLSSNVAITGSTSAKLNGQNIKAFSDSVVKKSGDFTVTTPVTIVVLQGTGELSATSTFDDINLHDSYNNHLIKDKLVAQTVLTKLSAPEFQFTTLNLNPASGDNSYFNNYNFVDYTATLLTDNNVQGTKVLTGKLTVNGNIVMAGSDHFFGIDINTLYVNTLFKSKEQTITVAVTANDITSKNIETHQVNDNEFAFWCFRDEVCKLNQDSIVKLSGITAKFESGLNFRGNLNSKSVDDRITALSTRPVTSITSLSTANMVIFTNPVSNGNTVTHLLTNSVRYSVRDQTITGTVTFNQPMDIIGNLNIDSKVITSTVPSDSVDFDDINTNAAFLNRANTFSSGWTVDSITVTGGSLNVDTLVSTDTINTINLQNYMDVILVRASESSYTQSMTGVLVLNGGLSVTNIADIKSVIDGVNVFDFVTKAGDPKKIFSGVPSNRLIPSVTLNAASSVSGDVVAGTTNTGGTVVTFEDELESFFDTVVYAKNYVKPDLIDSPTQFLNKALTFSNTVAFSTLTADLLNGINTDKIILRNSNSTQVINQDISLPQNKLPILGSLTTSTINGIDLTQTEVDILLKDRAETISVRPSSSFTKDVTVSTNAITIEGFPTLIQDFIEILEDFSISLNAYYKTYVTEPLRPTVEEIYVAKRIGSVRAKYLDEIKYNAMWYDNSLSYEILGIDTHQFTDDKYTVKMKLGKNDCNIGENCQCSETRIATQRGTETNTYDYESTVFTYISDEITLTAVSEFDGTNSGCPDTVNSAELIVEAVGLDVPSLKVTLNGTTAESLGTMFEQVNLADVYQVLNFDVVKHGNRHLMAFTSGYSEGQYSPRLQVYQVENGVVSDGQSFNLGSTPISLKSISLSYKKDDVEYEVAHVFVDEVVDGAGTVKVYEWKWNVNTGEKTSSWGALLQTLPTPHFSAMEVFKATTSNGVPEKTHLALGYQYDINLVNYAILDIFEYNPVNERYVYSTVVTKHRLLVDNPIRKVKAMKFTDYTTLAFSTDHKIQIVNFIPNVGYDQISEYEISENLVDWTLFQESLPKTMSNENLSTILFMIKMQDGVRSTETLRIGTEGKISLPDLQYKPDNLGF